ncbi:hypothetical protein M9H77_04230 [Catharanthus roseus]|uniref:Uncharacterized protein n=2 Tax=Catharanthus roseus TaxID=4058 RepID=A0ACC0CDH2_CATRO|nr:hypothetical protein M9H77_04230 [Catharanthus roseus]BAF75901.1 tetrahydroxychalcone 2'-glucosyltransferase [Catharanthus roseus]
MAMKTAELVFVPSPGIGHLLSTVELAKILVNQDHRLSITLLIMKFPFETKIAKYTKSFYESPIPRLKFIEIKEDQPSSSERYKSTFFYDFIDSHKGKVRDVLSEISISEKSQLSGVIVDMFCTSMIDVANEFGVPSYVYYTSGAAMLGLVLHFQHLRDDLNEDIIEYKDKDTDFTVPTYINPLHSKVLPSVLFDNEEGSKLFLDQAKRYRETKGIIINTFLELESHSVTALSEDPNIPPVYTAGPILNLKSEASQESELILKWLNLQPESSVVFLCFGSYGSFSAEQVKEIAIALENSGHRFLWSLRRPPPEGKMEPPSEYENLEEILPEGFLKRTAETGKIIGWAPQIEVLSHSAVGGFVSHCGWNSTLESVWCGVPMATWPIYAEQQLNAFEMVKDLEMAVEIKIDYRREVWTTNSEILGADLIEERIRCLMDPENKIRSKVKEMQRKSSSTLKEGGSSWSSIRRFIDSVVTKN